MLQALSTRFARFAAPVALVAVPGISSAAVPAAVGTTLTSIQADALSMIDLVWPVVLAVVGGMILIKVAKRVLGKV